MSSFLKKLLFASVVFGMGFSAVACGGDDDPNEKDPPAIFGQVSSIWENAECMNTAGTISCTPQCSAVYKVIADIKDQKVVPFKEACTEYNSSLTTNKNKPENLANNMDNSGFYLSTYILLYNMQKNFYACTIDSSNQAKVKQAWENLFNERGCTSILDDAEKIVKARGK